MMKTVDLVQVAFRKLKAHVYFDKTALPLRDKVVLFETDGNFKSALEEIADIYDNATIGHDSVFINTILSSIDAIPFPKKMKTGERGDESVISVGNPKEKAVVSELQYFIDMDVRGHILGIMWIMAFGKRLDEKCYANARGNKLRSALIWNDDGDIISSPALFEPYFAQYSLWRDAGLSCAEDLLAKGHDALILTLDLKKFYYKTGITKDAFYTILSDDDSPKNASLHSAVYSIIKRYTEVLRERNVEHSGNVLPIGFLPSAVLSNWCLSEFDKGILDFWNPSYYGRYVDDIIIVEKIEKGSDIYRRAREDSLTKNDVIDFYLGNGRRKTANRFVEKVPQTVSNTQISPTLQNSSFESVENEDNIYRVTTPFCLSEESQFEFQSNKTRIIALFADNNSTALLNKFKNEIHENVSAFRLMPDVGKAFSDDFSDFYRLDNDATINKLRGVKEISMDKYELSKFLGRYRVVSSLVDDGSMKKFTRIIGKMFNDRELVENHILWERVFEIFITDKDYSGFSKFCKKVKSAIDGLVILQSENETENVKRSLKRHLVATLNRVLSLLWGEETSKITTAICSDGFQLALRRSYFATRMTNKYVMVIPPESINCPSDDNDVNFTDFSNCFLYLCESDAFADSIDELLPYFRQAQDIATASLLKSICSHCNDTKRAPQVEYIEEVAREVRDAPVRIVDTTDSRVIISVGDAFKNKLKIAIANVNVGDVTNLEAALKGRKPNRCYKRYRTLADLVNKAIVENADMLVLPENYVPFEWLPSLASKAAREGIAIITGIEHMKVNDRVYNYTAVILPFKYIESIPTSAMFFQLKKHYSPEEKRIIDGYGYSPVEESRNRPLYRWYDCYFPVYCCYELASITDRAEYMSWADMVVAVEYNSDTNYFGNIVESLARDLHCYFVQVNTSQFGDSRITQPTKSEIRNVVAVKGGLNSSLLIGELDIQALREFQIKKYTLQKNGAFKPTPPGLDIEIVKRKLSQND